VRFSWIPLEQNKHADRLANEAMDAAAAGGVWKQDAAATFLEKAAAAPDRLSGWQDARATRTTMLLLRHGQTELSVERRFSGIGDQPLTEVGRAQAAAAALRLASSGAVAVVSSPLRRARETALLVAAALSLEVAIDDDFRETDFGDWEGCTLREIRDKWPLELDEWLGSTAVAPPFGESFDATAVRVRAARDRVLSSYRGQTVVVVSHVSPIKTLLRMALDAPPSALHRIHLDLASLNEVQWLADGAGVVWSMNDTGHLSA
jgi:ribonuclease H / adenosylcobalamin/alpha-ribazole phosphatase